MNYLSVCSLVRDESKNIIPLIKSVLPHLEELDEMVIVDGGSKDDTPLKIMDYIQTTENNKLRIVLQEQSFGRREWKKEQDIRNKAWGECKNDWILSLDADEAFDESFWAIKDQLINDEKKVAYYFPTYHFWNSPGRYRVDGPFYPDLHIRLADRRETRWVGDIHASVWSQEKILNSQREFQRRMFLPTDQDVDILWKIHLYHYARVKPGWELRMDYAKDIEEIPNPEFREFLGKHPREDFT